MENFKHINHLEIDESFQGINLNEFTFGSNGLTTDFDLIQFFLHSNHFKNDCRRNIVKANPDGGFLGCAFDWNKISEADFKILNKTELSKYLFDYLNETTWGEDRGEFAKLLDQYLPIHNSLPNLNYYVLNMDWFSEDDAKVYEADRMGYTYYFIIIWVDRDHHKLGISEWKYD